MRPATSCLLPAAALAAGLIGLPAEPSAQGLRGGGVASPSARGFQGRGRPARAHDLRRCGYGGCGVAGFGGYGLPLLGGYGLYGYGTGSGGDGYHPFDPRLLRADLPDERNAAIPAVAGIPAPPVQPPAIYVIGGEAGAGTTTRSGRASGRIGANAGRNVADGGRRDGASVVRAR